MLDLRASKWEPISSLGEVCNFAFNLHVSEWERLPVITGGTRQLHRLDLRSPKQTTLCFICKLQSRLGRAGRPYHLSTSVTIAFCSCFRLIEVSTHSQTCIYWLPTKIELPHAVSDCKLHRQNSIMNYQDLNACRPCW